MPSGFRARALERWGFTCSCTMCTAPKAERDQSDARRGRVADIQHGIGDPSLSYEDVVHFANELVRLAETENLFQQLGQYYGGLMRLFFERGDTKSAIKYGRAALEHAESFGESSSPFTDGLRSNLRILESRQKAN